MLQKSLAAEKSSGQSPSRTSSSQALTVIFALCAIIGVVAAIYFWRGQQAALARFTEASAQASHAEQNFKASKGAIDVMVSTLADSLGGSKIPVDSIAPILSKVEGAIDILEAKTQNDLDVRRSKGAMHVQFSTVYLGLGNTKNAIEDARKGTEIFRELAAAEPNNDDMQSNVGLSLQKLGEALRVSGDMKGALAADRESLEIARGLADKERGNRQFRSDVALALWRLASVGDEPRDRLTEALKILKDLKLAAMLTPAEEEWIGTIERDLSQLR